MTYFPINTIVRPLAKSDAKALFDLIDKNRKRLERNFPITVSNNETEENTVRYIAEKIKKANKKKGYTFVIADNKNLIGMLIAKNINWRTSKCELAYFIDGNLEGKGIMSRAMDDFLEHCFSVLGMNKVFARIAVANKKSKRLVRKKGFKLEGILREDHQVETGELINVEYYGKLKKEWELKVKNKK